jgi:hypothetical protein
MADVHIGYAVAQLVNALRSKAEDCRIESREGLGEFFFFLFGAESVREADNLTTLVPPSASRHWRDLAIFHILKTSPVIMFSFNFPVA